MAARMGLWKVCCQSSISSGNVLVNGFPKLNFARTIQWWCRTSVTAVIGSGFDGYSNNGLEWAGSFHDGHNFMAGRLWCCTCAPNNGRNTHPSLTTRYREQYSQLKWRSTAVTAFYSTDAPKDKADDVDPISRSSGRTGQTAASRIENTRQMLKETSGMMKDKVEEIIMRENIMTIPNMLCLTRIVLSPVIGYLILHNGFSLALGLFVFAGITDLLDGLIARNFKSQQSMFGSFLDPLADKLLVFTLVIALTGCNLIPVPLTALIIARDACLIGAGFYIRFVSLPPPRTLSRYFNATLATAQLQPTVVSKVNTAIQLSLVAVTLASPIFTFIEHEHLQVLWYITASTTVISALSYLVAKSTYFPLKKIKDDKK